MRVRRGVVWCVRWDTVRWDMERCGAARYGVVCEVGYGEVWCGGMRWRWDVVKMHLILPYLSELISYPHPILPCLSDLISSHHTRRRIAGLLVRSTMEASTFPFRTATPCFCFSSCGSTLYVDNSE